MAERTRSNPQVARDRRLIAEMWMQEMQDQEIADALNARPDIDYTMTRRMVCYDREQLAKAWAKEALFDSHQAIVKSLKEYELIKRNAWEAWRKSLAPRERSRVKEELIDGDMITTDVETWISEGMGDPRYLDTVMRAIARRDKLLGLEELKVSVKSEHKETIHVKMYRRVDPSMWDDPNIRVVDGEVKVLSDGRE